MKPMKAAIWIVFGVLTLLWTGAALAAAELTEWASGLIASGAAVDLGKAVAQWPVPAWMAPWVDVAAVQAAQQFTVAALEWLRDVWPGIASVVGWLVPVIWVLWALGQGLMLLAAGLGHWLAGRAQPQPQPV
jgi:hypothetical protein